MYPCALSCMVTNIGCLFLCEYFSNSIKRDMEGKNLKLQREYYRELEENQAEIRKIRHNMNHHLSVVKMLLAENKKEDAEAYFEKLSSQIASRNRVFCKNGIVNAVLNANITLPQNREPAAFSILIYKMCSASTISISAPFLQIPSITQ